MAEQWPPSLNFILDRGSFSIEEKDLARSDFDDGPQLVRVRFSNPVTLYSGSLTITNEEYQLFRAYYKNILNQGAKWFEIPIWNGNEYSTQKARFKEVYQVKDEGWNQYILNIKLEVRDYFTFNAFYAYIVGLYGRDFVINEIVDPLQLMINITYPNIFRQFWLSWDTTSSFDTIVWDQEDGIETNLMWDGVTIPFD